MREIIKYNGGLYCAEEFINNYFVAKADIEELLKRADIYCKEDILFYLKDLLSSGA